MRQFAVVVLVAFLVIIVGVFAQGTDLGGLSLVLCHSMQTMLAQMLQIRYLLLFLLDTDYAVVVKIAEVQRRVEQVKAEQARIRAEVEQMLAEVNSFRVLR